MKLNKTLKLVSIALITFSVFSACESSKAGNDSDKNNALLLAVLNRSSSNGQVRQACASAVYKMNQCIGSGSGFNPAVMCSDANLNQGITADATTTPPTVGKTPIEVYQALITCIDTQITATNCNFTQNKVASPVQAKAAFFSKCDSPSGLIITVF